MNLRDQRKRIPVGLGVVEQVAQAGAPGRPSSVPSMGRLALRKCANMRLLPHSRPLPAGGGRWEEGGKEEIVPTGSLALLGRGGQRRSC